MRNIYEPKDIQRSAVKENQLIGKRYILCNAERVTGFDWLLVKDENGNSVNELCNISGVNLFEELPIKYELEMANTFVFYVAEKRMVFSEALGQDAIEYVVTGWDILYPIKRGNPLDLFSTKKYISEDDLWKDLE